MDTMYERCCGLDIHKKTIEACFRSGKKKTHMSFGTTSAELRKLTMWLVENEPVRKLHLPSWVHRCEAVDPAIVWSCNQ